MGNIFRWDSPVVQKIAMVGNLVLLNILWVLCSLPIVTAGAATTALYYVIFQYVTNEEDTVLRPFFRAFVKNFKQSTLLWIPSLIIMALLLLDVLYMFIYGTPTLVGILIVVVCVLFLMVQAHLLPQVARFETKLKPVIQNGVLLTLLHMPSTLLMAVLNLMPIAVFLLFPYQFMQWLPLWVGIWFSLVALVNGRMLLKIWAKHMETEKEEIEPTEE